MRSRNVVVGLVASLATIALAIGLLFVLDASAGDEIELPDEVGDLVALDTDAAFPGGQPPKAIERRRTADAFNADGFSDAFDGASAGSRAYLDPDSDDPDFYSVVAVAADAGPLVPPQGFVDPEQLGLAVPQVERVTDGDVECLLYRSAVVRAGTEPQPDQLVPDSITCQRRSGRLTVQVQAPTGDQAALVDLVEDLWDELD